ncbi:MAG TPA: multicopper oxidase domain-containing protein [Thermomicrobiales bacterium]|nr:multicopper oxidase domain-containing protein [Thermomicrobiales bacterium]
MDDSTSRPGGRVSRRAVVAAAVAAPLGVSLLAHAQPSPSPVPEDASTGELVQPDVISSRDGVLEARLVAQTAEVDMGVGHAVRTYTFDGIVPGYTWEVRPGDRLKIDLVNDLPPLDDAHADHVDMTRPHQWTTTNLHTHGMHVSPSGNSDNVFITVSPGSSYQYDIEIPDDHTGGFFWYHPHKHGAVAHQVRAGMAGAIIVRGEIDEVPEIQSAKEQVMVLQAIELGDDYELLDPIPYPKPGEAFYPRTQILYPVNGRMNPRVTMYPGEVQRWRLLNAAEGKFMSLHLEGHDLNVLAWDGLTLHEPEPTRHVMMTAGNRTDVLVKAMAPGIYNLVLSPGSSQHPSIPGMAHATPEAEHNAELTPRSILTLEVVGEGPEMALPTTLPAYDPPILPIARQRTFAYTVERGESDSFQSFGVDGESFDPDRPPYQVKLGTAEEWTLVNDLDHRYPEHAHGFHIHVNPFRVTAVNGEPLARPQWRDTFALSGQDDDSFTCEMNFDDFTGIFVDHCHVLTHEDLGMMERIEVVP